MKQQTDGEESNQTNKTLYIYLLFHAVLFLTREIKIIKLHSFVFGNNNNNIPLSAVSLATTSVSILIQLQLLHRLILEFFIGEVKYNASSGSSSG